jgi:chorismate-pyruvate lyase
MEPALRSAAALLVLTGTLADALPATAATQIAALAAATPVAAWHDTPATRLAALALLQSLNAELLASPSATLTLERWCGTHGLAEPAVIRAEALESGADEADPTLRADLRVEPGDLVIHRRVALRCGARLLSVADNWYVPARLSSAMNEQLEHSDVPFGKVVQALQPWRRTLSAKLLWAPLAEGWERAGQPAAAASKARRHATASSPGQILQWPQALLEQRALMSGSDNRPIAELRETYQKGLFEFPEPSLP